jgi:class 3 adenylate cyclase
MEKALELHDAVMRATMEEFFGYEVKTEGDAFFASFERPEDAIRFCLKVQLELLKINWPEEICQHPDAMVETSATGVLLYRGLRVRMGLHTGEPTCVKNPVTGNQPTPFHSIAAAAAIVSYQERALLVGRMDYYGPMVNRSSRIETIARGGQIVLSDSVMKEVEHLMNAFGSPKVQDLGFFKLKGLDAEQHLFQLLPQELAERTFEMSTPRYKIN